ncbi:hypothetical protein [Antarctobacter heliothermus]|uniref:Uncharacterized protein n=1 Tax=Antarctobacter heliothermus TaxID=74033 RepID=A0A239FD35_9RHOB|nr:hypothetical protein [Antarctobacter heliothermus]SNS54062.1 hypothetical protein SAMN04488078_101939 [Antarctobacter heliothermus]
MPLRHLIAAETSVVLAASVYAQDLPLGPSSDFGRVVLSNTQASGAKDTLEQAFGGQFDSELTYQYPEISGYRKMGRAVGRLDIATVMGMAYFLDFQS